MNAPTDFPAWVAESRAKHLSPAIGAVWIGPNGAIQTTARGSQIANTGAPATTANLWHIGSCTKAMTATAIARLVERGVIGFDTPLGRALPAVASEMTSTFRVMPLSAVMTHGAGIARNPADSTFRALRRSSATPSAQRRFLAGEALKVEPDPQVGYSNLGYIVLGAVIEHWTRRSWEAALAREVMIPLGIARFGFGPLGPKQPSGHQRGKAHWIRESGDNPEAYGPAGRVHLALDEWGRFLRAHLGSSSSEFLRPETLGRLHRRTETGFAMGWLVRPRHGERPVRLHHTGSNTAWFAQATLLPERGVGVAVVCNAYSKAIAAAVSDLSNCLLEGSAASGP